MVVLLKVVIEKVRAPMASCCLHEEHKDRQLVLNVI